MSFLPGECADETPRDQEFLSATLESRRRCPARGEYLELCFTTEEGPWSWCFPEPGRRPRWHQGAVALTLGPYGVLARRVEADGHFGAALEASAALPMILAGADVVVARYLVTSGR
jgi:hypothetical protein